MADIGGEARITLDAILKSGNHRIERIGECVEVGIVGWLETRIQATIRDCAGRFGGTGQRANDSLARDDSQHEAHQHRDDRGEDQRSADAGEGFGDQLIAEPQFSFPVAKVASRQGVREEEEHAREHQRAHHEGEENSCSDSDATRTPTPPECPQAAPPRRAKRANRTRHDCSRYPNPRTVTTWRGFAGSTSIFMRNRRTCTSTKRPSPK